MIGLLGDSLIGTDPLTGPKTDTEEKAARFAKHERLRGKPILQDLGNDAGTKRLSFFFDETFCQPEAELRRLDLAFRMRLPLRLFLDLTGFEIGYFVIERLSINRQQTTPRGRVTRADIEADLIECVIEPIGILGAAAGMARAIMNPRVRKGS